MNDSHPDAHRRARRRLLLLVALALLGLIGILPAPAVAGAQTANTIVGIVNSASSAVPGQLQAQAYGSFVTIYTAQPVSNGTATSAFPWPTTLAGVRVTTDQCQRGAQSLTIDLPILYVGPSGNGSQINVYYPGSVGNEPFGTCSQSNLFPALQVISPLSGRTTAPRVMRFVAIQPGVFQAGNTAAGFHLRVTDGALTPITTCNTDPGRCPVSTAGRQNFLILYTTGAEAVTCNGAQQCLLPRAVRFRLTRVGGTQAVDQDLAFLGPYETGAGESVGSEQANVGIKPGTPAGDYELTVFQSAPTSRNVQRLPIRLGPAT